MKKIPNNEIIIKYFNKYNLSSYEKKNCYYLLNLFIYIVNFKED